MKLLRVIASMDPITGGPCQGIRNSIPALERLGIQNEVVCLDEPPGRAPPAVQGDPFLVHALGRRRGPWGYHPALMPWLRVNLPRFDAIIIHGLWLFPSFATWRVLRDESAHVSASQRRVPPCFVMPHGMLDPWFQRARPIKAMRNTLYWKLVEHRVIRDATGVLFTCQEEMRLARQPFHPYQPKSESVVGYGIPEPAGDPEVQRAMFGKHFPALLDQPYFLFLGRIHPKKGVDLLLRGYAQILGSGLQSSNSSRPTLVIAGPCADPAYLQSLKNLAASLGLSQADWQPGDVRKPQSVNWLPMLTGDVKWGSFRACEAFILPSHQENFGIAVVEALAYGKPVLISDKVNIWGEIEADGAGLVAPDTAEGTRSLLDRWSALDVRQKQTMSGAARRCFQNHFHIPAAAEALIDVIKNHVLAS